MGKGNNGSQQISNATNEYSQEADNANQLMSQFMASYYPEIQKLIPMLQSTVSGGPSALMAAAQAPVNANTAHALNTMQNNVGGTTNPDALYADIALNGNQNAALAGDGTLNSALSALQNLIGMGYGSVNTAQGSLNNAAGGNANLGTNLQQQSNQWWQSLLGAAGEAAGMSMGVPPGAGAALGGGGGASSPNISNVVGLPGFIGMGGYGFGGSTTPSGLTTQGSAPISSGPQP